jgi:DNA-binding response OmpR family regulator
MKHSTLDQQDAELYENTEVGYLTTPLADGAALKAWLADQKNEMQTLRTSVDESAVFDVRSPRTSLGAINNQASKYWQLDPHSLELTAPEGSKIPLSHNESCILLVAASVNGHLVSRKALIESLGQNYLHYDERRLEAIISRLRRKLAPYAADGFKIRGVKCHGYIFAASVQLLAKS